MTKLICFTLFIVLNLSASESIGTYGNGSLEGSFDLDRNDYGLQVMRLSRERFYGHDEMISFIKDLSSKSLSSGLGQLLIGDISDSDGGFLSGHASHQIGLDVDVWFWRPNDRVSNLPDSVREVKEMPIMLNALTNDFIKGAWDTRLEKVLKISAEDERVARIFVNPGIKKKLCKLYPGSEFLKKIRPWFRHHEHFHVRLKCPKDSPKCVNQTPADDFECSGEKLDWWFGQEFKDEYRRRYGDRTKGNAPLCDAI